MVRYFPVALRLQGRRCLVVGGGSVATRRIESLLDAGADVRVVALVAGAEIRALAETGRVDLILTPFQSEHLEGMFLVVCAADNPEVNAAVAAEAARRGVLCNDAETPDRGDFVVPSVVRRGDLLITVMTGGGSPALASRLREEMEARYGPEYAAYVALLGEVRACALRDLPDSAQRKRVLTALAQDDSILALLREGRAEEARGRAFRCISSSSA